MAALTSRSRIELQLLQVHSRSFKVSSLLIKPQTEHVFEDEYNGYSCWGDFNDAWENASEVNWISEDRDIHYCPDCYSYDDNDNLIVKKIHPSEEKKEEPSWNGNFTPSEIYKSENKKAGEEKKEIKPTIEGEKEDRSKFFKSGCIDIARDLWGNINCQLRIDPVTCGRESSCLKCERYLGK